MKPNLRSTLLLIDVRVVCRARELRLKLNGKVVGEFTNTPDTNGYVLMDHVFLVPYEAGELLAEGFENGKVLFSKKNHHAGQARRFSCKKRPFFHHEEPQRPGLCRSRGCSRTTRENRTLQRELQSHGSRCAGSVRKRLPQGCLQLSKPGQRHDVAWAFESHPASHGAGWKNHSDCPVQ